MKPLLCGIAALALLTAPALAETPSKPQPEGFSHVRYTDLDMRSDTGADLLLSRLKRAAERACEADMLAASTRAQGRAFRTCRADALANAVARIDDPNLTAAYHRAGAPLAPTTTAAR